MVAVMAPDYRTEEAAGTTVYVEETFTDTTTGTLNDQNLDVDELAEGWVTSQSLTIWVYKSDGTGLNSSNTQTNRAAVVRTDGREDVQVTLHAVLNRGSTDDNWAPSIIVRSAGNASNSGLLLFWTGSATDPDIELLDGNSSGTLLKTWDLSALMTTPPDEGDTIELVVRCSGDDITLYSIKVNAGSAEVIDDTHTLSGASQTAHGAGSGADYYGIYSHDAVGETDRLEFFRVESIPS